MMMDECAGYVCSQYLPHMPPGSHEDGIRSENLEELTFADRSFDLVVTQDVLEHVIHPTKAFREIERVLRSGGRHVFTVPYDATRSTSVTRALVGADGTLQLVLPPEYHHDALSPKGVLVVTDWGVDLVQQIDQVSAMVTTIHSVRDRHIGVDPIVNVFVSHKKRDGSNRLGHPTPKNHKLR
jgi:SAM-dependent methyltransferase